MIVHYICGLKFVRKRLSQIFEIVFFDEAWTFEIKIGAKTFVTIVILIEAKDECVGCEE